MKTRFLLLLFVSTLFFTACNKVDCDLIEEDFTLEELFPEETDRLYAAILIFTFSQTEEDCEEVQEAFDDLIDKVEDFERCAENRAQAREFRDDIEEVRAEIDGFCD